MEDSVIDEIARVRARLDNGDPRADVLRDAGRTAEDWQRDEENLIALLSDDIDTGRTERVLRFQNAYAELRGPDPTSGAAPASDSVEPVRPAVATAASINVLGTVDETMMLPRSAVGGALPFQPASGPAPRMITVAELMRGDPGSTGTREINESDVGLRPMPFESLPRHTLMTSEIDRAQLGIPAVPFSGSNPAPAPRASADAVVQSDLTLLAGDTAVDALAIPFVAADVLLPLEKYAEISAVLTKEGDPNKTFRRLGIDPAAWLSTVRTYSKRFAADPALAAKFDALVRKLSR